ncbi:MAG: hypothetical protein NTV00_09450 [Methylococcales bacterium]|nr:hypothetical protein [Methylococcales bacterium]
MLTQFGSFAASPGQFKNPRSIAISAEGRVLVADTGHNRIQKFIPKTLLSIPLAHAFGQDYQAQFKYLDDSLFQLQSATPK